MRSFSTQSSIEQPSIVTPPVAFLGVCDRATHVTDELPFLWKHHILGLRESIISRIYPFSLLGAQFAVAIYDPLGFGQGRMIIRSDSGEELLGFDMTLRLEDSPQVPAPRSEAIAFSAVDFPIWKTVLITPPNVVIPRPGQYNVFLVKDGKEFTIGALNCLLEATKPLTEDRIAAIRSDPLAVRAARMGISCNLCGDAAKGYTGLERSKELEKEGYVWYQQLPERFVCGCGKTDIDLTILRSNMHAMLGPSVTPQGDISFTRVYERDALQLVVNDFGKLLNADPPEESVQQFLRDYPVLLHQFSPERIFYKPPILSKFEADVVILNHKKELVLIELERPGKRLLIKDGGMAAETQHAFKQVNDWLYEASEHRSAVLSCLDLQPGDVNKIRGVVITGRDQGYDDSDLRKLKWTDFGQVDLFTYDDLIGSLVALVRGMSDL